jgi:1-pyrroline-5-carboxylate dehydrogenase
MELAATMVVEVAKNWVEADADVAEAIDFLEFYGREMVRLGAEQPLTRISGEDNALYYIPIGVGVIISPWNFPLAILTGMSSGAIVAGNSVLIKPASTSPVIAAKLVDIYEAAGVPPGVVNFVPGSGAEVGDYLVDHPLTRFVAFTGSKEIGTRINERAAKVQPGQKWLKRVVCEMGGKDAIVVDVDADLEGAAEGVVTAAFGFQGQKCSACSRLIVVDQVHDDLVERVRRRTEEIRVGDVRLQENWMGAVIDKPAFEKHLSYIEVGEKEGKLIAGGTKCPEAGSGYFLRPSVFDNIPEQGRLSQEEIFGPILAITRAKDFEDAIRLANATEFGLTGAAYSRNRARLEFARKEFHVGNLYLNRKCTGALVGAHPFGGFNMSGTDSKAGGSDYLLLFLQAKVVSDRLG